VPLDMSVEDLKRDLIGCVVIHKNKPVYVTNISRNGEVHFIDLITQKEGVAPFTLKSFTAPTRRLGFVNVQGSVAYLTRVPIRRYHLGLHRNNVKIKLIMGVDYPQGAENSKYRLQQLNCPELGDAMFNRYPNFEECVAHVQKFGGARAFDKQFAVCSRNCVYYKGDIVGHFDRNAKAHTDIHWMDGKKYLSILLEGNYEKAARNFRPGSI
jgi:hypothetical protein